MEHNATLLSGGTRRGGAPRAAAVAAALLMLAACAGPGTVVKSWQASDYHHRLTKVMVVALSQKTDMRRAFEYQMVELLQNAGVVAVPSVDLLPLRAPADKAAVKAAVDRIVASQGFDGLLVTHLVGVKRTATYITPNTQIQTQTDFNRQFLTLYSVIFSPGYTMEDTDVSLETNLYDAATGRLVWNMRSSSVNPMSASEIIKPVAHHIIADLRRRGLLPAGH